MMNLSQLLRFLILFFAIALLGVACQAQPDTTARQTLNAQQTEAEVASSPEPEQSPTPLPQRPKFNPGELVDYTAQTGDTLAGVASHFNTTVEEILEANDFIPKDATTLPPGMPMQVPIYYQPFWGTPFKIVPDSHFINGPLAVQFDTITYVEQQPGWLKHYIAYAGGKNRNGAEMVSYIAENFSISPRILLALLEYQLNALSSPTPPSDLDAYPLGHNNRNHRGLYLQLVWAANRLNNGYYGWRGGKLTTITLKDGTIEHPDPWQNAASVAFQHYFSAVLEPQAYQVAVSAEGIAQTYRVLFGNPWDSDTPHIEGSLRQPDLLLPFESGKTWAYTGGPHTGWGTGEPFAAIDFAPPAVIGGCSPSNEWVVAMADGVVSRVDTGILELDLDKDGDNRTGWVIFYLHISSQDKAALGSEVQQGQPIGHPSCEGGSSTGTHIHIARKYNGEWILADGALAFNLEGWVAQRGNAPYEGELIRFGKVITACVCSTQDSQITAPER